MGRQLLRWLPALVIAGTVLYTLSVYPALPARMPIHWGIDGRANGWGPRELGAWLLPVVMLGLGTLFLVLPKRQGVAVEVVATIVVAFEAVIQIAMLNVALGRAVDINTIVILGFGAMVVVFVPYLYWRKR